jgi:Divergent InlB B-repeat domain
VPLVVDAAGLGSIQSSDGTVRCDSRCVAKFTRGALVTLTAVPRHGSFTGWSGACVGPAPDCLISMDGPRRTVASFRRGRVAVDLTVAGRGTVTSVPPGIACGVAAATCRGVFAEGAKIVLTALPEPGYRLLDWSGGCTGSEQCAVAPTGPVRATATFRPVAIPPVDGTIDVKATVVGRRPAAVVSDPPGLSCPGVCSASFPGGTVVRLVAENAFETDWRGACVGVAAACRVVVEGALVVEAAVSTDPPHPPPPSFGLNVTVSGPGTVTDGDRIRCGMTAVSVLDCQSFFRAGARVVLRAVPGRNATFVGWRGMCRGRGACAVKVDYTTIVSAGFRARR